MEEIKTAKASMAESKRIVYEQILSEIQDAKKGGELYCKYFTKRAEINIRQTDEVMDYLITKGYDVYKHIPTSNACLYTYYRIFWDDESSGKYRNEDIKWIGRSKTNEENQNN